MKMKRKVKKNEVVLESMKELMTSAQASDEN